jgi:flagellar basal body-associated protein FliL
MNSIKRIEARLSVLAAATPGTKLPYGTVFYSDNNGKVRVTFETKGSALTILSGYYDFKKMSGNPKLWETHSMAGNRQAVLEAIRAMLDYLEEVDVDYLTLNASKSVRQLAVDLDTAGGKILQELKAGQPSIRQKERRTRTRVSF